MTQIKRFFDGFNGGIKERLVNPGQKEISPVIVKKLESVFEKDDVLIENPHIQWTRWKGHRSS